MSESKARIMGELVFIFQNAKRDAAVAKVKLRDSGFGFKIMADTDPESTDTVFAMVWRDYPPEALGAGESALADQFWDQVHEIIGSDLVDCASLVAPDFVPEFFGDFGEKTDPLLLREWVRTANEARILTAAVK
jgi:hypothetical protein